MNDIEGWYQVDFGSLLALIRNGYSGQQVGRITNFPVSRIETISDGVVDLEKVGFVDLIPDSYLLKEGDILFSNINSLKHIGKAAQVKAGTFLFHGMNLLVFRTVDDIDAQFLFYKLTNAKPWFEKMAAQAINQASINQTTIKELVLDIPTSKPEQTKIAEVLSKVDKAIEQTEAFIAKQQRIKTGLMQDLLTRGIDEQGNIRSEQTHKFKDSPLGGVPRDWTVIRFGEALSKGYLTLIQDGNHGEAYPRTRDFAPEGIPFISAKHIGSTGRIDFDSCPKLPREFLRKLRIGFGTQGDVVFAHNATVGPVGYVRTRDPRFIASTSTTIHRPDDKRLLGRFLFAYLISRHFTLQTEAIMGQTTRNQVPITAQKDLWLLAPSPSEQALIASQHDASLKSLESTQMSLRKLRLLKTALMQDLLTGKVRVTTLLSEPQEAGA